MTAFGVSPFGSTDTAMICMLAGSLSPRFAAPERLQQQRADVRAVRVDERDEDGLAAQRRELEELAVLVVQRDLGRDLRAA